MGTSTRHENFPCRIVILLTACAATPKTAQTNLTTLPDLGPAPELKNDIWLNVDSPLRLADLRGKVVAIDMWTFG
ncbi:hypothetical protein [Candidatus Villigracilis affinis]|uniref:hypothetical protein n=1 Tax=Candidatus Villigracilis affinis TaxID=3140682 RepID=UPI001D457352|nr:hypothetical protein [Anaerolineales bacterium]